MGKKKAASTKPGVMIYFEILPVLQNLWWWQRLAILEAIIYYAKDRKEPKFRGTVNAVWSLVKPIIDRDDERYYANLEAKKRAGQARGAQITQAAREKREKPKIEKGVTAETAGANQVLPGESSTKQHRDSKSIQSTISNLQSTTINPQSTVVNPQSPTLKERGISPEAGTGTEGSFRAPSLEEVKAFVQQEKLRFLPEDFMDYYTANGWVIGGTVMKDWKAVAIRWNRREKDNGQTESLYFGNYG